MDTIIYFYKKRGLEEPEVEPVGLKTYMLIRVGMDVGKEEWFGTKLDEGEQKAPFPVPISPEGLGRVSGGEGYGPLWQFLLHPLRTLRQRREDKIQQKLARERICRAEEERTRLLEEREERLRKTEAAMEKLSLRILELADEVRDCFCVYDDSVRIGLVGMPPQESSGGDWKKEYLDGAEGKDNRERTLASLWRECFPVPEFTGFQEPFWTKQLLEEARLPHFVILGTSPYIHEMIEGLACKMKSLRWILLEEDCSQERQDFVEDFYTEYGLAITLQPAASEAMLRRLRLVCEAPSNVLDFTGETRFAVSEVAEGSIWLDMMSVEEKRRRVEGQGRGILYFSLKKKWRHAQKRCNCPVLP